ncbi:glycoside hydrolase family 31 protein [Reichenbachiella sp. MSK19-1]|uniref:glycoside hydrolase family 31 protein n=1 Tax=Reichenbachiella sp. MSK19-1 TaxID=1897631 RepID=UPI000E6BF8D2|nr:glycoside hydrolase family 31 protein [Reichenbachiella sp. MSK19-1]RJE74325.1 glycoside hydrolase family 31 [Reichenbachiella sp. MSK19-1]
MIINKSEKRALSRSAALGSLTNYQTTECGLVGKTDQELFEVQVYSASTIRVRITQNDEFNELKYSVVSKAQPSLHQIKEETDTITVSTSLISLEISKAPLRFRFLDRKGNVLNEDDTAFGTSWQGEQVTTYKKLQAEEKFIGLGEKTGPLNKRGWGFQNWNTDHFGYGTEADPIYCSVPFYIGVHSRLSYGIFLNNSFKTHFNFGASNNRFSSFSADAGDMDYFFIHDDSVAQIVSAYSTLTGKMTLPPKWSLGYQQCRYSYYPDKEVLSTAQNFRDKEIPADVIVLDIHYMEKYKIFTWDGERFPDPESMILKLKSLGFEVVVMCDPGIKIEKGYEAYEDGLEQDLFIKYPDGTNYEGQVWPGWCHFPDFTSQKARDWWQNQLKTYTALGIEGYWNDMNEIATWGQTLPELIEFDFDGDSASTRNARNVYGMLMAKSTFEGAKENLNGKRPFNLTRAGFAGIQRYAAVWTGDNVASDEHMLLGMRMLNSMGLSGIPFAGFDTGGFVGNATEELFARWISMGAFTPFFRGHSNVNTRDSEPWAYGEHTEEISRNYINLRYRLMPYLYAMFYEASESGIPINRSLAMDYTHDEKVYDQAYENEFLFGDSILVAPVSSQKVIEKIYLPEGKWYDLFTDNYYEGGKETIVECPIEKLPVFAKESAIIPMQSKVSTTKETPHEQLEIHLYNGEADNSFVYYEDDGTSYDFEGGGFHQRTMHFSPKQKTLTLTQTKGDYKSVFSKARIYFHGYDMKELNTLKTGQEDYRFIRPLTDFDPLGDSISDYYIPKLPYTDINLGINEIKISWS